jgi:hypothetical protein
MYAFHSSTIHPLIHLWVLDWTWWVFAMKTSVDEFAEELAQDKTFMCESCDGLRRPVYITISSRHLRANHNLEQNMRSCVYYMDLALRMGEAMGSDGRVTNIVDCRGKKSRFLHR